MDLKKYWLIILPLTLLACAKEKHDYSSYQPDLMELKVIRSAPYIGPIRDIQYESQMEIVGDVLYILDRGNGIHAYSRVTNKKVMFLISPGCTNMQIDGSKVNVDRTVDLAQFGPKGNQTVTYLGATLNVLPELQPPDGKAVPPIFQRANRLKDTEIIRWEKIK